ncbi:MAG: transcriptional regulator, partial [Acidobacteria bacterium]|nr:transcriptional regulator [Acidobacteriota bacterium]
PHEMLRFLMEQRRLRQRDLLHIFGSRSVASAVVNERGISKAQAKALGAYFHISPEVFL